MEKKYRLFLKNRNLKAAKEEVNKLMASRDKRDVLREVAGSQSPELIFHTFSTMKEDLGKPDVANLLDILENLKNPMIDGEEIAAYIRTKKAIASKIEQITGIQLSEEEKANPEKMKPFIAKVKKWRRQN